MKKVFPTTDGNGFKAFQVYDFELMDTPLPLYYCPSNHDKVDSLNGKKSAHLWDGKDWYWAGFFVELNPNNYRAQLVKIAAYRLAMLGFETYLSKSETYGFFVNSKGFVIGFQSEFSQVQFSGKYIALNQQDRKSVGSGWSDNVDRFSLENLTEENLTGWNKCEGAPRWATADKPVRLLKLNDMLSTANDFAGYTSVNEIIEKVKS